MELLTPEEMGRADAAAIDAGTPGIALMEAAGQAIAETVSNRFADARRVLVLAGPGNNGGDGYVVARLLAGRGCAVTVCQLGDAAKLKGDAALAAAAWGGAVGAATPACVTGHDLVIDALFGAGLARPVTGAAGVLIEAVNADPAAVLAVDLPSGVSGETGLAEGAAIRADATVTFFRKKPGHLLYPGRGLCGPVDVHDIGIPSSVLGEIGPKTFANEPALWRDRWHPPVAEGHKYARGHAVVVSGPASATGAARLAAMAALRAGAGLVSLASPPSAVLVNAAHLTAVMVKSFRGAQGLAELLSDARLNAVAIGPGIGTGSGTKDLVGACLVGTRAVVLDADALTAYRNEPQGLFGAIAGHSGPGVAMTPHEGEFSRLFPDLGGGDRGACGVSKPDRARVAAARSGAVVVLKGPDTVIAAPDGRVAINANAPPWLATAGSGDVLTGIVAGLLAQKMPPFEAAAMAVWMHGKAASRFGPGMIAEDLAPALPAVFADLLGLAD
ncbi:bifunctional ADP-dependent NAD(P)H-hydrate dehydratase/NAD(P)H-hydrate epimerase [Rhodobium orientis]|uniref:Bifunctional NAD(P)H-hydrate repair enzyme n=2 Tax=Rhodobium orientis TaxID=34017 RepID=A0A327K1G4_9HYPH|nr:bifunctional ADP-dependent NAD(P)H-hydrate dehydratase/NAD(P)H-hydrate epimerase [Rhodobium orientis]RAI29208.1 bifunctional ADP-dependent NAD(P)H-hydrate dehydratase/NAD(P)H-hydrate epimerase [Rhodobium orientis]